LCCSKQKKSLCKTCAKQIKNFRKNFNKIICSKPVYSAFDYKNEIKKLILNYKFQGKKSLYKDFSEFLIEYYINSELKNIKNPIFIPIPSYFIKNFKRGYCHNNLIIKDFCDCLKLDYNFNILYKSKYTKSQFRVSPEKRINNIKNSFSLKNLLQRLCQRRPLGVSHKFYSWNRRHQRKQ
jgi:predicted amidophosphoribosyltransferase